MKKIFLTSLLIVSALWTQNALAAVISGNCGPRSGSGTDASPYVYASNCTYEYDTYTKTLTISGKGSMSSFTYIDKQESDEPWRGLGYETVVVEQGITSIGDFSFSKSSLQSISLPESLTSIGRYAFAVTNLNAIDIPKNVRVIAAGAFSNTNISSIILPEGITTIPYRMLQGAQITELTIPASVTNIDDKAFSNGINTPIEKIYCSAAQIAQCEAAVAYRGENVKVEKYQIDNNGMYFYKNHWYASSNDIIGDHHILKRSYTPAEAAKVVGDTNTLVFYFK